jgi:hypothetical protein
MGGPDRRPAPGAVSARLPSDRRSDPHLIPPKPLIFGVGFALGLTNLDSKPRFPLWRGDLGAPGFPVPAVAFPSGGSLSKKIPCSQTRELSSQRFDLARKLFRKDPSGASEISKYPVFCLLNREFGVNVGNALMQIVGTARDLPGRLAACRHADSTALISRGSCRQSPIEQNRSSYASFLQ